MDWHLIIPREGAFTKAEEDTAYEVRLRAGRPMQMTGPYGTREGTLPLTPEQLRLAAQALTGHTLSRQEKALQEGYLSLPGGHRMGVCGHRSREGMYVFSSLCVRMAHEVKTAGEEVFPLVKGRNVLILGPAGSGKTTLLRDLIRRSARDMQVAVADTRGEIAACFQGEPQLDVGKQCDVMTGGEKGEAMLMMLRSMAPQVMAADEIGNEMDTRALMEMRRSGVHILSTAHAATLEEARQRSTLAPLFREKIFDFCILLSSPGQKPRLIPLCEG